jgi:hypothetical protein
MSIIPQAEKLKNTPTVPADPAAIQSPDSLLLSEVKPLPFASPHSTLCPVCACPACALSGGWKRKDKTRLNYWACQNDDCEVTKFSVDGLTVKVITDEPGQSFRNAYEAMRVLGMAVRDDKAWFGEITEETRELIRVVLGQVAQEWRAV